MTHHDDIQVEIPDFVRGRLSGETSAAIEAHLARCPECEEVRRSVALIASAISRRGESVFDAHAGWEELRAYAAADGEGAPAKVASHVAACASCALMVEMWRRRGSRSASRAARPYLAAAALLASGVAIGAGLVTAFRAAAPPAASEAALATRSDDSAPSADSTRPPAPPNGVLPHEGEAAAPSASSRAKEPPSASEKGSPTTSAPSVASRTEASRTTEPPGASRTGSSRTTGPPGAPKAAARLLPATSVPSIHLRTLRGGQGSQVFEIAPGHETLYMSASFVLPSSLGDEAPVLFEVRSPDGASVWTSAPEPAATVRSQLESAGTVGHLIPVSSLPPGDYELRVTGGDGAARRDAVRIDFAVRTRGGPPPAP